MIVGAAKSGTTTLSRQLFRSPGMIGHNQLECNFFLSEREYSQGFEWAKKFYFHDHDLSDGLLVAKSVGLMLNRHALHRLYDHNPDCVLVCTLRNPVDRAYSAYWYARLRGWEKEETFENAVQRELFHLDSKSNKWYEKRQYLRKGIYISDVKYMADLFGSDKIFCYLTDELNNNLEYILKNLYEAVHAPVPDHFVFSLSNAKENSAKTQVYPWLTALLSMRIPHPDFMRAAWLMGLKQKVVRRLRSLNEATFQPPPMQQGTREELLRYFRPYNEQLAEYLGRDLSHWGG